MVQHHEQLLERVPLVSHTCLLVTTHLPAGHQVEPMPSKTDPFKGADVPDALKSYYMQNDVRQFVYSRPFIKGPRTDNEFENAWTERNVITCEYLLPGILNRSPVVGQSQSLVTPIENAIEIMAKKNEQVRGAMGGRSGLAGH